MGTRINTVMQACFFGLSGVLPRDEALAQIKAAIKKSYARKGEAMVRKNFAAVDAALDHLDEVEVPDQRLKRPRLPAGCAGRRAGLCASRYGENDRRAWATNWRSVNCRLMVPIRRGPRVGKSAISPDRVPVWDEDLCVQCGNCSFVCPHSVIRAKFYHMNHI